MKKILNILLYVFICVGGYAQTSTRYDITDSVVVHEYYNSTYIRYDGTTKTFYTDSAFTAAYHIRYFSSDGVAENSGLDEDNTLPFDSLSASTFPDSTYMAIKAGSAITEDVTINDDKLLFGRYGNGVAPIINNLYWDTLTYSGVKIKSADIESYIYSGSSVTDTTNWYFAETGNDSYSGHSIDSAKQTLTELNSIQTSLEPNDSIFLRSGDIWNDSLLLTASGTSGNPIVYTYFGSGNKPVINGSSEITGWTNHSGDIYKATVTEDVNQVFEDDERSQFSIYPSDSYLTVTEKISSTRFRCSALSGVDIVGSYIIARWVGWSFEARKVTAMSGDTITVESAFFYDYAFTSGDIFKVSNSLEYLSGAGQTVYDESTNTVYLHTTGGDSPENYTIIGSVIDNGVSGSNLSNIVIDGLNFKNFKDSGVKLTGKNDSITISDCDFYYNYASGIDISTDTTATGNTATGNTIIGSNRNGINLSGINPTISSNNISKISLERNMNFQAFIDPYNTANGIKTYFTRGAIVELNILDSIGYNGVMFVGKDDTIRKNTVSGFCLTLDDGGGIYTNGDSLDYLKSYRSDISNNFISHSLDTLEANIAGAYLDAVVYGVSVRDNTIVGCSFNIQLNNLVDCSITGNTLYDYTLIGLSAREYFTGRNGGTNVFNDNIMFSDGAYTLRTMKIWSSTFADMNITMSGNVFGMEAMDNIYFIESSADPQVWDALATISEVETYSGLSNIGSYPTVSDYANSHLFYNATNSPVAQDLSAGTYRDLNGDVVGSLTLQPFTSKILVLD